MQEENELDPAHMKFSYEGRKHNIGRRDKWINCKDTPCSIDTGALITLQLGY